MCISTIGIMIPEIKHDFFSSAISSIEEIAYQSGYTIIAFQSNESYEWEVLITSALMRYRVAGVILSISQNTKNSERFKYLLKRNIPLVLFFDRVCGDIKASKVVIDDYKSAFDAVTFLINKGYKKITHYAGPHGVEVYEKRLKGYGDAIRENKIPFINGLVLHAGLHTKYGYESMDSFFKSKLIPAAIFTENDPVTLGVCKRIKEAGLKIPKDIAAIGFTNIVITSMVYPSLTTVDQFRFEMGR